MSTKQVSSQKRPKSQVASTCGAIGFVVAVAALSFVGTTSAVTALNRNAANEIAMAKRAQQSGNVVNTDNQPVREKPEQPSDTSSELSQLDWAKQYGITWDNGGNPIDSKGNVMNDPTTSVNEVARAIANGSANADGVSVYWLGQQIAVESPQEPVEAPKKLYEGVENVSQLADGTYIYTVQKGDCLTNIGAAVGVDLPELIRLNDISNPSVIEVGQQIKLPSSGVVENTGGAGLG